MKVVDLQCAGGHRFEGWFGSDEDLQRQKEQGLLRCPLCNDTQVHKLPSAPRLNLGAASPTRASSAVPDPGSTPPGAKSGPATSVALSGDGPVADLQRLWLQAVRQVVAQTEDVGPRFSEEARRIHYGEAPARGIRGQATSDERAALADEGIEVVALPVPPGLDGPLQ